MIEDKTDFEKVVDFGNLYQAYLKSKSGKGFSKSSQKFQVLALDGIHQIKRRLETKTYQVSKYNEFIIYEPKERVIKACSFVDKIVQHSLCDNVLIPRLNKEFIQTNYAGQIGKGTLYGLDCLKAQMYLAYQKYGYDCWIVKADIGKFFYNINHDILKDILKYFIEDKEVKIYGVEPLGKGEKIGENAASLTFGREGILHGFKCLLLQNDDNTVADAYSVASGLDYPGVGPKHCYLKDIGRVEYKTINDKEAIDAFYELSRTEGIIPALESSHAVAYGLKIAKDNKGKKILISLSGRGDKDIEFVLENYPRKF